MAKDSRPSEKSQRIVHMLKPALLLLLEKEPSYGYSLVEALGEFGLEDLNLSVVYRALQDMERQAWLSSSWKPERTQGAPRRVYTLTAVGRTKLADSIHDLEQARQQIEHLLQTYYQRMGREISPAPLQMPAPARQRIAIAANGADLGALASPVLGRCPIFILVNPETMEYEAAANPAAAIPRGADIPAAQFIVRRRVDALVTSIVGPEALAILRAADIPVYMFGGGTVREAIQAYQAGKLHPIPAI